jgi:hypothetical protein
MSNLHLSIMELSRQGVSLQGAQQVLTGQIVTGLADRHRLAQLTIHGNRTESVDKDEMIAIHAEKNQDIEVENDETHWVGHDNKLQQLGVSALGARQFLSGQPVTSAADRQVFAVWITVGLKTGSPAPS